jgi:hypothetical protein
MTTYDSFKIINLDTFNALGLPSRKISAFLGDLGLKDVLVTKGNYVSILFDGVFLSLRITQFLLIRITTFG